MPIVIDEMCQVYFSSIRDLLGGEIFESLELVMQ